MNLGDLIRELGELGLQNGRLNSDIKGFLNRAQRAVCQRYNWTFMHDTIEVVLAGGETKAELPPNFKELGQETSPISYALLDSTVPIPVEIFSRAQMTRLGSSLWNRVSAMADGRSALWGVFIEQNAGGGWTLNLLEAAVPDTDTTFTVSAYFYLDDLEKSGDRNALTDHGDLCEALLSRARALAYSADANEDPEDKRAASAMKLYDYHVRQALYADSKTKLAGRSLRM